MIDPLSLAAGTAVGFFGGKMLGKKKPATKRKAMGSKRKSSSLGKVGINKSTGRLKKGYKYGAKGRVIKAKG